MLRFGTKLIIFLAPLVLMLGLVEHKLSLVPSKYQMKRTYLERSIGNAEVIITGSSHSYFGIRPEMLGAPSFSIAYVNQDVYYDSRILLKYLPRATSVRVAIIAISYFTFEHMLEDSPEEWRTSYYSRFWEITPASREFRIADHSFIALYGVEQSRSLVWGDNPLSSPEPMDENGGSILGMGGASVASVMDASAAIKRHNAMMKTEYVRQNRRYLEELFAALNAKSIRIVIITTPCFHSYYDNLNTEAYDLMQNEIESLCRNYGSEYHNYLTDARFTVDDFADCDHLSKTGAAKFSKILRDEVVKEYIR